MTDSSFPEKFPFFVQIGDHGVGIFSQNQYDAFVSDLKHNYGFMAEMLVSGDSIESILQSADIDSRIDVPPYAEDALKIAIENANSRDMQSYISRLKDSINNSDKTTASDFEYPMHIRPNIGGFQGEITIKTPEEMEMFISAISPAALSDSLKACTPYDYLNITAGDFNKWKSDAGPYCTIDVISLMDKATLHDLENNKQLQDAYKISNLGSYWETKSSLQYPDNYQGNKYEYAEVNAVGDNIKAFAQQHPEMITGYSVNNDIMQAAQSIVAAGVTPSSTDHASATQAFNSNLLQVQQTRF